MFRSIAVPSLITVTLSLVSACGASEASVHESSAGDPIVDQSQPQASPPAVDYVGECVAVFTRQHDCTDDFIPMLVDARIKHDTPPGIAGDGDTPEKRDALIAVAKQEWAVDGAEPKRTQTCQNIVNSVPQAELDADLPTAQACLAKATCGAFVSCMAPIYDKRFAQSN